MTNSITDFLDEQDERQALTQAAKSRELQQAMCVWKALVLEALGEQALAALQPDWGVNDWTTPMFGRVKLYYKGETFTMCDAPHVQVARIQARVGGWLRLQDEREIEQAEKRATILEVLQARPLADYVCPLWWERVTGEAGTSEALRLHWPAAIKIWKERMERKRAASLEFKVEVVAEIENARDVAAVDNLTAYIPPSLLEADRVAIIEAGKQQRALLQEAEAARQKVNERRVADLERASFVPFLYYQVTYQVGVAYEEDDTVTGAYALTETVLSYDSESDDGWWRLTRGERASLTFVSKVEECTVATLEEWPSGLWDLTEQGGLVYRVPSRYARRTLSACAQAKEV